MENPANAKPPAPGWRRILMWVLLGVALGAVCAAIFFAYGQPALLLEQMNLRYCG